MSGRHGNGIVWTPDLVAELTRLWNDALTTAEIGRHLGLPKNAIVGKAHRLGLPARESPIHPNSCLAAPPKRPEPPREQPQPVESGRGCQFPKWHRQHPGEPGYGVFCGKPQMPGSPYCPTCHAKAHQPQRKRDAGESAAA